MSLATPCSTKVWICLYTCCTTRAVHLDIVRDLTASSFVQCFRRFVARRGLPKLVVSDNAKTFKKAAKVLALDRSRRTNHPLSLEAGVEWNFNIERAPWWGGFFERLVQSTKRCLRKMVGRTKLLYDELNTLIVEVEAVINSRPLFFVSSLDLEEPLTPSHLMFGRRLLNTTSSHSTRPDSDEDYGSNPESLSRRVSLIQRMLNVFWERWKKEYLLELRSAQASSQSKGATRTREIKRGDVVIVHDECQKRGFWRLRLIEDLLPGRDGRIRGARVRVSVPGRGGAIWRWPLERLFPLEVSPETDTTNEQSSDANSPRSTQGDRSDTMDTNPDQTARPTRPAADRAENRIRRLRDMDLI